MQRQSARWWDGSRIVALLSSVLLAAGCGSVEEEGKVVRPGIDVLLTDSIHLVQGLRVGLITNQTGIGADGVPSIDRLSDHPGVQLVALFSPEHGIRGTVEAGVDVADQVDVRTGLPIHSLFGATLKPTPSMLDGIEVLLFDIQDVGARYYTYIYTMALAMEAAGEASIPFIVLDRPNPVGGRQVQGNILDPAFASFVGRYPLPMRHGMTPGELAILFRQAFGVEVELRVVPIEGWSRDTLFSDTGLPWRSPSPNMPDLESALHYSGTCLFEGTNLSVGRGTERAFQWVGAPWLDGDELARILSEAGLPGVRFHPARFTPREPWRWQIRWRGGERGPTRSDRTGKLRSHSHCSRGARRSETHVRRPVAVEHRALRPPRRDPTATKRCRTRRVRDCDHPELGAGRRRIPGTAGPDPDLPVGDGRRTSFAGSAHPPGRERTLGRTDR